MFEVTHVKLAEPLQTKLDFQRVLLPLLLLLLPTITTYLRGWQRHSGELSPSTRVPRYFQISRGRRRKDFPPGTADWPGVEEGQSYTCPPTRPCLLPTAHRGWLSHHLSQDRQHFFLSRAAFPRGGAIGQTMCRQGTRLKSEMHGSRSQTT